MLDRDKARALIAVIDTSSLTDLRDRALIGIMIYTFARVRAVLQMNAGDNFIQGRRGWARLHQKGGKEHEAPCHHKLEAYPDEYIGAAGIAADKDGPLLRTTDRSTGTQHRLKTKCGNHTLRATGITDYLKRDGSLAVACKMANHADTRTTQLYDRRSDTASLGEYEKAGI